MERERHRDLDHDVIEACRTCKHFSAPAADGSGECHRFPPQLVWFQNEKGMVVRGTFPPTKASNACGEHALQLATA